MSNRYKGLEVIPPGEAPRRNLQMGLDGGYRTDVSPMQLPPDASPDMDDVRFERTAVRKDFGWSAIGVAASNRVLGIIEHKFVDSELTFHRIARFTRIDGNCVLEVWDGVTWVTLNTTTETIKDEYLSMVSAQGAVYVAEGTQILEWVEAPVIVNQEDDFPTVNSMTALDDQEDAVISPADGIALDYTINYDVEVTTNPDSTFNLTLHFLHEGTKIGERTYIALTTESYPFILDNEVFEFNRLVANNDDVSIKIGALSGGLLEENDPVATPGTVPEREGDKTPPTIEAYDDNYRFQFDITVSDGCTLTVGFYTDDGAGFVLKDTEQYDGPLNAFTTSWIIEQDSLDDANAKFGIHRESISGGGCSIGADTALDNISVIWSRRTATFDVHGHNKAIDVDDPAGVTYTTESAPVSTFAAIADVNAPKAKYLIHFARRLIALIDDGDEQSVAWPVDGDLTDWTGVGSGQIFLVESRNDAIDPLRGAAVLGSNFLAVFRSRSIWRGFETGLAAQAIGVVSWLEDLGTSSPFSIQHVIRGAMFLGHDLMVYYITESGPVPVGKPIHQELITDLTSKLNRVDSGYDPIFAEYYLGIPVAGADSISKVWIFDLDRFLVKGETIWRRRTMDVERFGVASEIE